MKKVISLVLAVLMLVSCSGMAFAAETEVTIDQTSVPQSSEVTVKTVKTDGSVWYYVTIPADTSIPWSTTTAVDMSYDVACQLEGTQKLTVAVTSTNGNKFVNATLGEIAYTPDGFDAKEFNTVTGTKDTPVTSPASITVSSWAGVAIGEYSDTLTYTVSVA